MKKNSSFDFKKFFNIWFLLSVCIILLGLFLKEISIQNQTLMNIKLLLADALQNIGLAIIVANIFNFIIGTDQFIDYIREKLIEIVLSKEFVSRLSENDQKKLLKITLKPTRELTAIYSGIEEYFDEYIDNSMKLFDSSYRGQMNINADASIDKKNNCLKIEWDLTYIIYKVAEKFEPIPFWLGDEKSIHVETQIIGDNLDKISINDEDLEEISEVDDPSMARGYTFQIPETFNKYKEVTIRRKFVEYGSDHWQIFCYKAIKPCHRMFVTLQCEKGLSIKEPNTFGVNDEFFIEHSEDKVRFSYNGWLSPGYGVTALISLDSYHA